MFYFKVLCATPIQISEDEERRREIEIIQEKSLHDVTHELVRQVTSPNTCVREQAMHSLTVRYFVKFINLTRQSILDVEHQ